MTGVRVRTSLFKVVIAAILVAACSDGQRTVLVPSDPTVVSVVVSGAPTSLLVGGTAQLLAQAQLSDGSSLSVTSLATWATSAPSIAAVSPSGFATAVAPGTAAVSASYRGVTGAEPLIVLAAQTTLCGVERWPVKTLSDPDASAIDTLNIVGSSISDLNALAPHCSGIPDGRSFSEEFKVFEVVGTVTSVTLEDDRDYHVVLSDPASPSATVVTEVVDPTCPGAASSPYASLLATARTQLASLAAGKSVSTLVGRTLRIRGVGFYDFDHGQTGRSKSCIELHAVLAVQAPIGGFR